MASVTYLRYVSFWDRLVEAVFLFYLIRYLQVRGIMVASRRCTTISTANSLPPEVSIGTGGIVSELVEPLVP